MIYWLSVMICQVNCKRKKWCISEVIQYHETKNLQSYKTEVTIEFRCKHARDFGMCSCCDCINSM